MKMASQKKAAALLVVFLLATALPHNIRALEGDALHLSARYAVLMDADSKQVLFAKDCDTQAPMASTTKIMTALLLLEAGEPMREFVATEAMVRVEGTSMGLRTGDIVSRYALAVGMLLSSGNDAANAAAIHLAGTVPGFAALMNARAREIGMTRSHFVTPSGLDAEGHCATAYDMALLAREALQNPLFREICGQTAVRVTFGSPPGQRTLYNHNRLLQELPGCIGVKTGFTNTAGRCLVSAAEREGRTLIAVTFGAPSDWADHRAMHDYGFAQYHPVALDDAAQPVLRLSVAGGMTAAAPVVLAEKPIAKLRVMPFDIRREILVQPFIYAPLPAGKVVGAVRYYAGKTLLTEVPLVLQNAVALARPAYPPTKRGLWARVKAWLGRR
ncbi:MAG: D-alanyl-D-alanine carboxypeptidase [Oscillospiraceae bacterium]|jgi:D-alanyl-D-alanine carboxypeptidase/D-alanyl-D-alanine carboxypeptidase (penicillin-binding protein 5/6)|nr:D-alanyl-D-alanine carboxypeptidase [Oscillospiraceae bacterium]